MPTFTLSWARAPPAPAVIAPAVTSASRKTRFSFMLNSDCLKEKLSVPPIQGLCISSLRGGAADEAIQGAPSLPSPVNGGGFRVGGLLRLWLEMTAASVFRKRDAQ